jgi:hypothetical protein
MITLKCTLPIFVILATIVSLSAAAGTSLVSAQNMTGNATEGNMTAGGNLTNATSGNGNMTSPTPLAPIK